MMPALPPPDPPSVVITVAGRPLPDPAAERVHAIDTIGQDELASSPNHQLDAILLNLPGLQLFRRSDSTSGHPTSQGVTLRALGGNAASRALLILDGVPQADPFGGWVNWPAYDPAGLGEVRVIRGGGSVAHGPGALAGVIELTSLSAEAINGSLEAGSRSSLLGRVYLGTSVVGGTFSVNARGARSDGFVPVTRQSRGPADRRSPYEEASVRARWLVPLREDVRLEAGGLAFVDRRERGLRFTGNRTWGLDGSIRLTGTGGWQWSALIYTQRRNLRSSFASTDDDRTEAVRVALQDSVPSSGLGASLELRPEIGRGRELRLGLDARRTTGESRELFGYVDGDPMRRRVAGGKSLTSGMFVDGSWNAGILTLAAGARLDHWKISDGMLLERVLATGAVTRDDDYRSRSGWRPTARAAALLEFGSGFSMRSAAYLGWRPPTLNELFRPFRAGADATAANSLLEPERGAGAEIGMRYGKGPLELELTAFANRLSDAIGNVTLGHGPGNFPGVGFVAGTYRQRQNFGEVKVRGIEASAHVRHGDWAFRLGASFSDAKVQAEGVSSALDGLRPAQTPRFTASSGITWENAGRVASLQVRHAASQFEDDLNLRRLPSATTIDAYFAWPVSKGLQLVARGENLLDELVVAGISDEGAVERATPITLWIGLQSRF